MSKAKNRLFDPNKSLLILYPEIAAEWHPSKNTNMAIEKVTPGCNAKVWWKCSTCGYEYLSSVYNRTGYKHVGCSICNKYMHTSFPEQAVFFYLQQVFPIVQSKHKEGFDNQMELDIFIPNLNVGIEYDGSYWHSTNSLERNTKKYSICQSIGITLIRIKEKYHRYPVCEGDCDFSIYRNDESDSELERVIKLLIEYLSRRSYVDINISRDRAEIKSKYIVSFRENSLLSKHPMVSEEWHPTKNGVLKPNMVMPSSHDKVWWRCSKCGYEYVASPAKRTGSKPTGCPVCANRIIIPGFNDLATKRPDIACEWHPMLNADLLPSHIAPNYSKKVWWKCHVCGDEYQKTPNKRVSAGQGCNRCSEQHIKEVLHTRALKKGVNDLASQNPELLDEWDYESNKGICEPDDITIGNSSTPIHWICSVCGYRWTSFVYNRTRLKCGCKLCGREKMSITRRHNALKKGVNDLASQRPDLLRDWDYENNANIISPDNITLGNSSTQIHWRCGVCGYKWTTTVYLRVHRGYGCRICSRRNRK